MTRPTMHPLGLEPRTYTDVSVPFEAEVPTALVLSGLESRTQEPKRARTAARRGDEGGTQEKRCPRCLETKARDQFARKGPSGLQPYCKPCSTANLKEWLKRPGNRARHNASIGASHRRAANPEKVKARSLLNYAVARGRVVRGACEIGANCSGAVEAHHDDYNKPLDVRWLCVKHHKALHVAERAA